MSKRIKNEDLDSPGEVIGLPDAVEEKKPYTISPCGDVVSKSGMAEHLQGLLAISRNPGQQRDLFLQRLKTHASEDSTAITVGYGDSRISVTVQGDLVLDGSTGKPTRNPPGVHPLISSCLRGAAPANKKIGNVVIPCGVCLIVAGGGAGKSPLAHALASHGVDSYSVVRAGEPLSGYSSSSESIAFSLAKAVLESSDIVLDSIKDLLAGGGSAMKSGLSRDALVSISGWAALAAEAGCTIYVPVNPSTPDKEVLALLVEAAKSNATMEISSTGAGMWAYSCRQGESLPRTRGGLTMKFSSNGLADIKFEAEQTQVADIAVSTRHISTVLSYEALNAAQRRSMANQSQS